MNTTAYLLLRAGIGISMFGHGLVRIPKLSGFSAWMVKSFESSFLPAAIVQPFSYVLPFAELISGLLILVGLFTRQALVFASFLMIVLIFGSTTVENWEALPSQLVHLSFFAFLLNFISANTYALDLMLGGRRTV